MKRIQSSVLEKNVVRIFEAMGAAPDHAKLVAELLIKSELAGYGSHGVGRVRQYVNGIKNGILDPVAVPEVVLDLPSVARVDGRRAFGQVVAKTAMTTAVGKARETGLAMVAGFNSNHVGRLSDYVKMAAEHDLMALMMCNGGGPNVAAHGARNKVFGTNPVAFAVPSAHGRTMVMDFATSAVTEGNLRVFCNRGEQLDEKVVMDKDGHFTDNPQAFFEGGATVPIGRHKGSALSGIVEIMAGIFTGARCSAFDGYVDGNGIMIKVMRPDLFRPREEFDADIELLYQKVTGAQKMTGVDRIYFAGEPELENVARIAREGVDLDEATWSMLLEISEEAQVNFET
jgi:uncharacterized oxidoreductase